MTLSTSAYWSTLFPRVYAQKKRRSSSARQYLCSYARHCKASRTQRAKIAFYLARLVVTPRPNVIRQRRDSKNKSPSQNALGASFDVRRLLAPWTLVYETRRSFSMGSRSLGVRGRRNNAKVRCGLCFLIFCGQSRTQRGYADIASCVGPSTARCFGGLRSV